MIRLRPLLGLVIAASLGGAACDFGAGAHDWPGAGECADDGLDQVRHALRAVCAGAGVPAAGMPSAPSAIRKAVLLGTNQDARIAILNEGREEWHRWSSCIPADWAPASVADAELVVCVGAQQRVFVDTCPSNFLSDTGGNKRYAITLDVDLHEASTGVTDQTALLRHEPGDCPSDDDSGNDVVADAIAFSDVEGWLAPLVERRP